MFSGRKKGASAETEDDYVRNSEIKRRLISELSLAVKEDMSNFHLLLCGVFVPGIFAVTEWGFKNYTKYEPGDMNLVITAPHGGLLKPSRQSNDKAWPDRKNGCLGSSGKCIFTHTCGETSVKCPARLKGDLNTASIARDIADAIKSVTGFRPHVVYNRLTRSKLDVNRDLNEATFNIPDAREAFNDFTSFIYKAKSAISGRGFLLDVHGHANKLQRTQLGYLIHRFNLEREDFTIGESSIRSLGKFWCAKDDFCFKGFVHGNRSLGHLLNREELPTVPSPLEKVPNGHRYFHGGYIVEKFGSRNGGEIDAIQIEFPKDLRFKWGKDAQGRTAKAILGFLKLNYV